MSEVLKHLYHEDFDPDRNLSSAMIWDNSIDGDDCAVGSAGGYDRHGNFITNGAMSEIIRLRWACQLALDVIDSGAEITLQTRYQLAEQIRTLLNEGKTE